jgi:hypothetical protein
MLSSLTIAAVVALATVANGKVYFKEDFNDKSWETKWTVPTAWKPTVSIISVQLTSNRQLIVFHYPTL